MLNLQYFRIKSGAPNESIVQNHLNRHSFVKRISVLKR